MRGKYVANIILGPSASLHGRHVQKSSVVKIVASIVLPLRMNGVQRMQSDHARLDLLSLVS